MSAPGETLSESGRGFGQLFQSGQSIAEHGLQIQGSRRLIQAPESLRIVGVQLKEMSNQSLRNLRRHQIHSVQSTKQRQQIEPGRFQTGAQTGGNFYQAATGHGLSMAHRQTQVNGCRAISGFGTLGERNHAQPVQQRPVIVQQQQA